MVILRQSLKKPDFLRSGKGRNFDLGQENLFSSQLSEESKIFVFKR